MISYECNTAGDVYRSEPDCKTRYSAYYRLCSFYVLPKPSLEFNSSRTGIFFRNIIRTCPGWRKSGLYIPQGEYSTILIFLVLRPSAWRALPPFFFSPLLCKCIESKPGFLTPGSIPKCVGNQPGQQFFEL